MKSIQNKITAKGITKTQVALMVGIDIATLSRVIAGKQKASKLVNLRIHTYLDAINTDQKSILKELIK